MLNYAYSMKMVAGNLSRKLESAAFYGDIKANGEFGNQCIICENKSNLSLRRLRELKFRRT
jgi:hypothetical protein